MKKLTNPMIYYSDNPELKEEVVITKSNNKEYKINCRRIEGEYYIINVEVFNISGRWYRPELKSIVFDHEKKEWIHKSKIDTLVPGIIGFNNSGSPIRGLFSRNIYKNCKIFTLDTRRDVPFDLCLNENIIPSEYYTESIQHGIFYHVSILSKKDASKKLNDGHNAHNDYSIDDNPFNFDCLKNIFNESQLVIKPSDSLIGKTIDEYSYGLELEASYGNLPEHLRYKHGIYICRDGSLRKADGSNGPEFVTVPLSGAKAVRNIKDLSAELTKRCIIGTECSYHLHVGSIRTDREFLVALYKLGIKIQNEVFSLFPFYKTDEIKYAGKEKNYAKKLKNIIPHSSTTLPDTFNRELYHKYVNNSYNIIFAFLLEGGTPSVYNNRRNMKHPRDRKWERSSRYYWLNFMNMFFSKRNTIEFRIHTPTLNSQKILSWMLLCTAIINYAEKHSFELVNDNLKTISLKTIIEEYFSSRNVKITEYMLGYIAHRKKIFTDDKLAGDLISPKYIENDSDFVFKFFDFEKFLF